MVFGAQYARHFTVGAEREEFHSGVSVYDAPPIECVLQPRTRAFKERRQRGGFADKSAEKAAQREKIFYLSGWIEKAGKMEYDKETSKKRISISERG